jgi:hypothetical protein
MYVQNHYGVARGPPATSFGKCTRTPDSNRLPADVERASTVVMSCRFNAKKEKVS